MKNKTLNFMKKVASAMLVTVMLVGVSTVSAKAAEPQEEIKANSVVYEHYTKEQFDANYKNSSEAPEAVATDCAEGYVFGGWFTLKAENTYYPVTDKKAVNSDVYAKFVPAYVMSVKCQNVAGTTKGDTTATMKFVSAVDSSNYKDYNFIVSTVKVDTDGKFQSSKVITNQNTVVNDAGQKDKLYKKFSVYGSKATPDVYTPEQLFGAEAKYFTTWGIEKIKNESFGNIICIQPTWTTLDGTVVEGLTKYAHVEDGFVHEIGGESYRYVNVPINLRHAKVIGDGVAAGVLTVASKEGNAELVFDSVESGRFFEEMEWAQKSDTSVKLVGNTATIEDKNMNDVYANIRFFIKESDASKVIKGLNFTVTGEDFSNNAETQYTETTYNVCDVYY